MTPFLFSVSDSRPIHPLRLRYRGLWLASARPRASASMVDRFDHNVDWHEDDMEDMDRPAHEMTDDLRVTERTYVMMHVNVLSRMPLSSCSLATWLLDSATA